MKWLLLSILFVLSSVSVSETRDTSTAVSEIRISSQKSGQYITPGKINNRWVKFMVDTGATKISMNSFLAEQLNIDYKRRGVRTSVDTANGKARAHVVTLDRVSIGSLVVNNPEAYIIEGRFPQRVLLGNSFLNEVSVLMEKGVMVLKSVD